MASQLVKCILSSLTHFILHPLTPSILPSINPIHPTIINSIIPFPPFQDSPSFRYCLH